SSRVRKRVEPASPVCAAVDVDGSRNFYAGEIAGLSGGETILAVEMKPEAAPDFTIEARRRSGLNKDANPGDAANGRAVSRCLTRPDLRRPDAAGVHAWRCGVLNSPVRPVGVGNVVEGVDGSSRKEAGHQSQQNYSSTSPRKSQHGWDYMI